MGAAQARHREGLSCSGDQVTPEPTTSVRTPAEPALHLESTAAGTRGQETICALTGHPRAAMGPWLCPCPRSSQARGASVRK